MLFKSYVKKEESLHFYNSTPVDNLLFMYMQISLCLFLLVHNSAQVFI